MIAFTIGKSSITVFLDGKINTIDTTHANYAPLLEELRKPENERNLDIVRDFVTVKKMLERYSDGRVTVTELEVVFDGSPISNYLAERMMLFLDDGIDIAPYAKFLANVHENPASYIHQELYEWLEKGLMPITPDGHFLGFKKVRADYTDCHTGKFDHSVGTTVEMARSACNPNRHQTCSTGFHFCSPGYLKSFGGERVVVVKINPRDVTSIPSDYQFTKGRTCRYEVIAELADESAAHHGVWNKPIARLEDNVEYPAEIVSALMPGYDSDAAEKAAAKLEAEQTDAIVQTTFMPASDLQKIIDDKGASWTAGDPVIRAMGLNVEDTVKNLGSAIERVGQTMAVKAGIFKEGKQDVVKVLIAGDDAHAEELMMDSLTPEEKLQIANVATTKLFTTAKRITDVTRDEDRGVQVFSTSGNRVFSEAVIRQALSDASIRGAAKDLGIGESTLRGWKKKLGL